MNSSKPEITSFDVRAAISRRAEELGIEPQKESMESQQPLGFGALGLDNDSLEEDNRFEVLHPIPTQELEKMLGYTITKVAVPTVRDDKGRLSDVLNAVCEATGMSVIPFKLVSFPNSVVELQSYDVETIGGEKFAISRSIRNDAISNYVNQILERLKSGINFEESLWVEVTHQGITAKTLRLSNYELSYLCTAFSDFKSEIKQDTVTGDVLFEVCFL